MGFKKIKHVGDRGRFSVSFELNIKSEPIKGFEFFFGGAGKQRERLPSGGEEPMTASGGNLIDSEVI